METTFLLIRCDEGSEKSTIRKLRGLDGICDCSQTMGTFDIIARLEKSDESLESAILKMPEVRRVTSLICRKGMELLEAM